jgi:hypothetical protein
MDTLDKDRQTLEYLYKEYVRLGELCENYTKSSFEDFKLLGAISVLLAWKPIAEFTAASTSIILFGFLAILFIVAIVGTRDLIKQSIISYYLSQIKIYEEEIRINLDRPDASTFRSAINWEYWSRQKHAPVLSRFYLLINLIVIIFPTVMLISQKPHWYAGIYAALALVVLSIYLSAVKVLYAGTKHIL